MVVAGGIAGVAVGLAAVYGIGRFQRNAGDAACRPAVELAQRIAPLARGEVAALVVAETPLRLPNLAFRDAAGTERHLADWRGRTVLFNLWATWCVPCRKEMPALDALEGKLGGPAFEVVAVNIDTRDPDKPRNWLKEVGIDRLAYYADPSAKVFQDLKVARARRRHADDVAGRSVGLRDRHRGGPGRMGERGCGQADLGRDWAFVIAQISVRRFRPSHRPVWMPSVVPSGELVDLRLSWRRSRSAYGRSKPAPRATQDRWSG